MSVSWVRCMSFCKSNNIYHWFLWIIIIIIIIKDKIIANGKRGLSDFLNLRACLSQVSCTIFHKKSIGKIEFLRDI